MNREDLREIIARVIERIEDEEAPKPACFFGDDGECDATTRYAIGEES